MIILVMTVYTVLPKVGRNAGVSAVLNLEDAFKIRKVHKSGEMHIHFASMNVLEQTVCCRRSQ